MDCRNVVYHGECRAACPDNTLLRFGTSCFDCHERCDGCTAARDLTACLDCSQFYILEGTSCIRECPLDQQYYDYSSHSC